MSIIENNFISKIANDAKMTKGEMYSLIYSYYIVKGDKETAKQEFSEKFKNLIEALENNIDELTGQLISEAGKNVDFKRDEIVESIDRNRNVLIAVLEMVLDSEDIFRARMDMPKINTSRGNTYCSTKEDNEQNVIDQEMTL